MDQITGQGTDIASIMPVYANAGLSMLPILSFGTNAAISEPEVEVAFDNSLGADKRDYFQSYLPPEDDVVHNIRLANTMAMIELIGAIASHPDGERLRRGANQYQLALSSWRLGRELLSLAHLWIALEAITKVKMRSEMLARGCADTAELASQLNIELRNLDATIRKDFLLEGDDECYRQAKAASDGFEHGFSGYDEIRSLSKNVRQRMATYIRKSILTMCEVSLTVFEILMREPFDKPLGLWPLAKYLRGHLYRQA